MNKPVFRGLLQGALAGVLALCLIISAQAADPLRLAPLLQATSFTAERVHGPFAYPWSLAFLPDGAFLVTEKPGRLKLIKPGQVSQLIAGVPRVQYGNQGGLMDVVLAPDFARSGLLYLSYSHRDQAGRDIRVRVMRARLDRPARRLVDRRVIYETSPPLRGNKHLGGRMVVTADGYLFLTLGERGIQKEAQNLHRPYGAILRLHLDGRIPTDNPFARRSDAKAEIWSYGHRNPQGLALEPQSGLLWANEHGPRGGDELNRILPGQNYGWPLVSYGVNYIGTPVGSGRATAPGISPPLHYWVPSIATSGLAITRHGDTLCFWNGGLVGRVLSRLTLTPDGKITEARFLDGKVGRIRDVRLGPDGHLYVLTDASRGYLYRLHPHVANKD